MDANIPANQDLLGKTVDDLQEDIEISEDFLISGTLKHIADYSSAGYTGDEKSGNFLALHCEVPNDSAATITVEVIGGDHGPSTLDEDGLIICRIKNTGQFIKVTASKTGCASIEKIYALTGLTLADA